jgi:hypothetical protein
VGGDNYIVIESENSDDRIDVKYYDNNFKLEIDHGKYGKVTLSYSISEDCWILGQYNAKSGFVESCRQSEKTPEGNDLFEVHSGYSYIIARALDSFVVLQLIGDDKSPLGEVAKSLKVGNRFEADSEDDGSNVVSLCIEENNNEYYGDYEIANCIIDRAIENEDYSQCSLQKDFRPEESRQFYINSCISKIAIKNNDMDKCFELPDIASEGTRNFCYTEIAINNKDISICENITEDEQFRPKYTCEKNTLIKMAQTDVSVCDQASTDEVRIHCQAEYLSYDQLECPEVTYDTYYSTTIGKTFSYPSNLEVWERENDVYFVPDGWNIEDQHKGAYPIHLIISEYTDNPGLYLYDEIQQSLNNNEDFYQKDVISDSPFAWRMFVDRDGTYSITQNVIANNTLEQKCSLQILDHIVSSTE